MAHIALCAFVILYIVSVIGSYLVLGDTRNDPTTRIIFACMGRNPSYPFSQLDLLYFFVTPWIPLLNTYLIVRVFLDNPELLIQLKYMARSILYRAK